MFKHVLLILVFITVPAMGDTLQFASLANSWIEGSSPGSWNGFNAWFLDSTEVAGGPHGVPIGGSGDSSDPFRYLDSHVYLQGQSQGLTSCDVPNNGPSGVSAVCADLILTNTTGFFSDPNTFHFHADASGRIDPQIYTYFGLPQDYLDVVGDLSFQLKYGSTSFGQREFFGYDDPGLTLHPVPEPATFLLLGTGIAAALTRRRHNSPKTSR